LALFLPLKLDRNYATAGGRGWHLELHLAGSRDWHLALGMRGIGMHVRADPKLGSSCEHPSLPVVLDERKRTAPIQKCSPLSLASTTLPQDAKPAYDRKPSVSPVVLAFLISAPPATGAPDRCQAAGEEKSSSSHGWMKQKALVRLQSPHTHLVRHAVVVAELAAIASRARGRFFLLEACWLRAVQPARAFEVRALTRCTASGTISPCPAPCSAACRRARPCPRGRAA